MSEELKPCPFCGSKAEYEGLYCYCTRCGCRMADDPDEASAIAAWNRRASPRVEEVRREALEEAARVADGVAAEFLADQRSRTGKHTMTDRSKIIEVMRDAMFGSVAWSSFWHKDDPTKLCEAALTAYELHLKAKGLAVVPGWQPIESAPTDRLILVYCPSYQGLNAIVCCCQRHEEAGFCVDELRSPSHWMPLPAPPTNSTKEESDE